MTGRDILRVSLDVNVWAHPFDVLDWLRASIRPTPDFIRARYGARPVAAP